MKFKKSNVAVLLIICLLLVALPKKVYADDKVRERFTEFIDVNFSNLAVYTNHYKHLYNGTIGHIEGNIFVNSLENDVETIKKGGCRLPNPLSYIYNGNGNNVNTIDDSILYYNKDLTVKNKNGNSVVKNVDTGLFILQDFDSVFNELRKVSLDEYVNENVRVYDTNQISNYYSRVKLGYIIDVNVYPESNSFSFNVPYNWQDYSPATGLLYLNFGDYEGDIYIDQNTCGVIIAPNATVYVNCTLYGRVIADTVVMTCMEIHQPSDYKTPEPTPTPTNTPTPTSTPTPTNTPTPTPTSTPTSTPTPTNTPTPSVTPPDYTPKTGEGDTGYFYKGLCWCMVFIVAMIFTINLSDRAIKRREDNSWEDLTKLK